MFLEIGGVYTNLQHLFVIRRGAYNRRAKTHRAVLVSRDGAEIETNATYEETVVMLDDLFYDASVCPDCQEAEAQSKEYVQ